MREILNNLEPGGVTQFWIFALTLLGAIICFIGAIVSWVGKGPKTPRWWIRNAWFCFCFGVIIGVSEAQWGKAIGLP
jgi:hypothetical protein